MKNIIATDREDLELGVKALTGGFPCVFQRFKVPQSLIALLPIFYQLSERISRAS
jgi:hypothetical protein